MGALTSFFTARPEPRRPVKGFLPKLKNIFRVHYRGIIGCLIPLLLLPWQAKKGEHAITVRCMWIWMFWFFLWQPVNVPVTGMIPVFLLPMAGAVSTVTTCQCYFNENIALYILAGMLLMLVNSCGLDRRIILWLLCSGDNCQFSGKRLIFKACTAAYFLSMFSNRLIVSSTIIQYITPAYMSLQTSTAKYRGTEPNYDDMRNIVNNAIQIASSIGSTAMIHSAYTPLTMRAIWATHPETNSEYPDIFNYLQYTCFAFPVTFIMFILNFSYHMVLLNMVVKKPMSANSMTELKNALLKYKSEIPKRISGHEQLCAFFYFVYLLVSLFRWSAWLNYGWASFYTLATEVPAVKDATVAAIFLVALHILPRTCTTLKFITANTRSELGVIKPESSILWWKFIDKNTNYGYIVLIGSGIALNTAIRVTRLNVNVAESYATFLTDPGWSASLFLVCLVAVALSNAMTGVAACCIFLPFVLNMVQPAALRSSVEEWKKKLYAGSLAVGMGTSYGFFCPFLYTPAYFCNKVGKVPIKKMILYSIIPAVMCVIVLWLAISSFAPVIWDPQNVGIQSVTVGTAPAAGPETTSSPPVEENVGVDPGGDEKAA